MRTISNIIGTFLMGILLVLGIAELGAVIWGFIQWDFSYCQDVWNFLDPRQHQWLRVVTVIWAVFAFIIGLVCTEIGM